MAIDYLVQEDGFRILLEDGSGFLILESSFTGIGNFPTRNVRLYRKTATPGILRKDEKSKLARITVRTNL